MAKALKFTRMKWDVVLQNLPSFLRSVGIGFTHQGRSWYVFIAAYKWQVLIGLFERVDEKWEKEDEE